MLFLHITVALILLSLGLGLTVDDFRRVLAEPRAVAVGMFGQLVVLPALAFAVAAGFALGPELAVGLVLIACCPGGAHSNLFANLARGDTALSVTLTAVSGVVTIATIPAVMWAATTVFGRGTVVTLPVATTAVNLVLVVALPLTVGMFVRARWASVAKTGETWVKSVAFVALLVIVVGSVARQADDVVRLAQLAGLPVLVMHLTAMAIGAGLAVAARLPRPQVVTVVLEVGVQNSALAVGLAMGLLGSTAIATPAIVYSLLVYATAAVVVIAGRRLDAGGQSK